MEHPVLWHFPFSHFAEKARWALDWKGIPHERRALLPGLHYPRVWWLTGQATIPVLRIDGRAVADSTAIIATLEAYKPDPALYPRDAAERRRALELEEFFDEELGHYLRRFLMHRGFQDPEASRTGSAWFTSGHGAGARWMYRLGFAGMRALLRWRFDIDAATAEIARRRILAALDRIEHEMQPSGYLVGDRFSVADLTGAALCSPLVMPAEFPDPPPVLRTTVTFRDSLGDRPALRWVADMYRRHRGAFAANGG